MSEPPVIIRIRDKYDRPLPGALVEVFLGSTRIGGFEAKDGRGSVERVSKPLTIVASYKGLQRKETLAVGADECTMTFPVCGGFSPMGKTVVFFGVGLGVALLAVGLAIYLGQLANLLPLTVGAILVAVATILAFAVPNPTPLQGQIMRSMFALGLGGCASQVPGLLKVDLSLTAAATIGAGGAIAVYVITFFFLPAGSNARPQP